MCSSRAGVGAGSDRAVQSAGREASRGILRTPGLALLTKVVEKSRLTDGSGGGGALEGMRCKRQPRVRGGGVQGWSVE